MDDLRKMTTKMLIKHLAYELNGDLSNKEIKKLVESPQYYLQSQAKMSEKIKKVGNKAKDIFLINLKPNTDSQSQNDRLRDQTSEQIYYNYFNNLIDSYIKAIDAIDSLKNLYIKK